MYLVKVLAWKAYGIAELGRNADGYWYVTFRDPKTGRFHWYHFRDNEIELVGVLT